MCCRNREDVRDRHWGSSLLADFHGLVYRQQHPTGDRPSAAALLSPLTFISQRHTSGVAHVKTLFLPVVLMVFLNQDPERRKRNPIPGRVDVDGDYQIFVLHVQAAAPPAVLHQMGQVEQLEWLVHASMRLRFNVEASQWSRE